MSPLPAPGRGRRPRRPRATAASAAAVPARAAAARAGGFRHPVEEEAELRLPEPPAFDDADEPVAMAVASPAAEPVPLQRKQKTRRERGRQGRRRTPGQDHAGRTDRDDGDDVEEEHQPKPPEDQPDLREEQRRPAETFLDEDERQRVRRGVTGPRRRTEDGVNGHGRLVFMLPERVLGLAFAPLLSSQPSRLPLVEGTRPPWRGSIATAARSARASALKQVSAMWWLFSP